MTPWGVSLQGAAILFDVWWHDVYGLDTFVFSPPHGLIAWGINFYFGHLLLAVRHRNAAAPGQGAGTAFPELAIGAMLLGHFALSADPHYGPMSVRALAFVISSPPAFAFVLVLVQSAVWAGAGRPRSLPGSTWWC